jgi:hypothetical protein
MMSADQPSDRSTAGKKQKIVLLGLVGILVLASLYCSLVPDPHMTRIVPGWIGRWADKHTILRTALPFFGMAALLGLMKFRQAVSVEEQLQAWKSSIGWPSLAVTVCELAQIPLPKRVADIRDVAAGVAGAVAGAALAKGLCHLALKIRSKPSIEPAGGEAPQITPPQ